MFTKIPDGSAPMSPLRPAYGLYMGMYGDTMHYWQEFRQTLLAGQWPTPLIDVQSFSNHLIWPDPLHVAYRGFAPNFAASCLLDFFHGSGGLDNAFDCLKSWSKARAVEISMDEINVGDDGGFPTLNAKGFDVKWVCVFLAPLLYLKDFTETAQESS